MKHIVCGITFSILLISAPLAAGDRSWTSQGPDAGRLGRVLVDPTNPTTLYAVSLLGDVFKSIDEGRRWFLPYEGERPGFLNDLAMDPSNSQVLLRAGSQISRSIDGGQTWSPSSTGLEAINIRRVLYSPVDPSRVYAGTFDQLFRSLDGGFTWSSTGLEERIDDLAPHPTDGSIVLAATPTGLYRSLDGGISWVSLFPLENQFTAVAFDPSNPQVIYTGILNRGIYKSSDGGATWTFLRRPGSAIDLLLVDPHTSSTVYASSDGNLFRSLDEGRTWPEVELGAAYVQISSIAPDPTDPTKVYVSGHGGHGVLKSTDGGGNFTDSNHHLRNAPVNALALSADQSILYAGVSGKGVFRSLNGGRTWLPPSHEGFEIVTSFDLAADPVDPSTLYFSSSFELLKTTDGGATWVSRGNGLGGTATALKIHPANPDILYAIAGSNGFYKTTDGGQSWTQVITLPEGLTRGIALHPSDQDIAYVGVDGRIYRTEDGGQSWEQTGAEPATPGGSLLELVFDPGNPSTLFAASSSGLFKSTDGGAFWFRIDEGLDGLAVAMVIDPTNHEHLVAARTLSGVYESFDGGATWALLDRGIDTRLLSDVAMIPGDPSTLLVATDDRGVFDLRRSSTCLAGAHSLCIDDQPGDERFEVRLNFDTALGGGRSGAARATELSDLGITDGGIFSFFDLENPEALVKVVNGCDMNGHYWIFGAAATTVGHALSVLDTVTMEEKIYTNPDQTPTATITDIQALATCDAEASDGQGSTRSSPSSPLIVERNKVGEVVPPLPCESDATTLCIDGRFAISLRFDTVLGGGFSGDAHAIPLAPLGIEDGGIFSFFEENNPEALVKVVDGCEFNGHVWVFAAAGTNVGFTLTVTDVALGLTTTYTNPDENPAQTVTDIMALAACDDVMF